MSALLERMLTAEECAVLSELMRAKWLALRGIPQAETVNEKTAREAKEAYDREVLGPLLVEQGYGEELLGKPAETFVASDLTLRCCACGSNVDKTGGVVHCFTCQRGKPL